MDDLVQFLRARLDEDARDAEAAGDSWYGYEPEQQIAFVSVADARHIARHSPFRVLSDIAAKLDLLELHEATDTKIGPGPVCMICDDLSGNGPTHPCRTLRLLARPYADHPDYRDTWRP
ncbi:DUF6221 family protein [Streptomyces sp. NPDC056831]|uniref:DUF6221 family protein n=1 Tax=Streptomyces sp. NPDC056831 TaxID=3345954 RepID=UPI003673D211